MHKKLLLTVCAAMLIGRLSAATYHVAPPPAGSDTNSGLSWDEPMATISNALAQADVELVLVSNGLYEITATITNAKAATVRGVNSPGQTNTIIDGGGAHRCFVLNHAGAVLDGLVITNGYSVSGGGVQILTGGGVITNCLITGNRCFGGGSSDGGGGIWLYGTGAVYNSRIIGNRIESSGTAYPRGGGVFFRNVAGYPGGVLENCLIAGNSCTNSTTYGGGGMFINVIGTVRNCVISNNLAAFGAGVTMTGGGVLTNCTVADNLSLGNGGGIYLRDSGSPGALVTDCVISNNRTGGAGSGGGIYLSGSATQIVRNCIITHNCATNRDGGGVVMIAGDGGALIDGCTIEYNQSAGLGNIGGGGIYVTRSGAAADQGYIVNSVIRYNQAAKNGGGVALYRGGVVSNCVIEGNLGSTNSSAVGGGVYTAQGGLVAYSRIISNVCYYLGGGVYSDGGGVLINCLIAGNISSNNGGGLHAANMVVSNGSVQSCTFADNETVAGSGGGIYVQHTNYFINTVIWSNRAAAANDNDVGVYPATATAATNSFHYCCTSRDLSTANQYNITNAPDFVDFAGGDYRLASGSAGINAGTNESWMAQGVDLDGHLRLDRISRVVDMGCYEHIARMTFFQIH